MIYIIAGLIIIVLFLCAYILKLQGYRITKAKPEEVPREQREAAEKRAQEFEKVLNYNLETALKRERGT